MYLYVILHMYTDPFIMNSIIIRKYKHLLHTSKMKYVGTYSYYLHCY